MRRLLVAGIAALAVVLGLCTFTSGSAFAQGPFPGPGGCTDKPSCAHTHPDGIGLNLGVDARLGASAAATTVPCPAHEHRNGAGNCVPDGDRGGFPGGPRGWHPGAPWGGPTLYGHQLWLNANLGLDICGYGNSYDTFLNRNLSHRSDIDRYLGRGRWQSLYTSDCNSNIAILPGGLTLVNGSYLNLDLLGLQGGGLQSVCSYPDWNTFDNRLGSRFGGRWGNVRNRFGGNAFNEFRQLRVNAHCTTIVMPSSTTIVQSSPTTVEAAPADPAPAATAPSGDDGASKPLASSPVPSGPVQTGGDSAAYVLAHARAV
jgi:hypothetical protein